MSGLPLSRDEFLVPVTVGPFPGWAVDLGRPLGLAMMVVLGGAFALLVRGAQATRGLLPSALLGLAAYVTLIYLQNGGFVYTLANSVAVAAFLALLWVLAGFVPRLGTWDTGRRTTEGAPQR